MRIWVENAGHASATHVAIYAHYYALDRLGEQAPLPQDAKFDMGTAEIPPGKDALGINLPLEFNTDKLSRFYDGYATLVMFGHIAFDDGFGKLADPAPSFCFSFRRATHEVYLHCTPVFRNFTDRQDLLRKLKQQQEQKKPEKP